MHSGFQNFSKNVRGCGQAKWECIEGEKDWLAMTLPDEKEGEGGQEGYVKKDSQSTCYQNDKAAYFSQ